MHEAINFLLLTIVVCGGIALTVSGCADIRNVMDYGVCSVRHQGCGQ